MEGRGFQLSWLQSPPSAACPMLLSWPRRKRTEQSWSKEHCWIFLNVVTGLFVLQSSFIQEDTPVYARGRNYMVHCLSVCVNQNFFNASDGSQFIGWLNEMPEDRSPLSSDVVWSKNKVMTPEIFLLLFMSYLSRCWPLYHSGFTFVEARWTPGALSLYLDSHLY